MFYHVICIQSITYYGSKQGFQLRASSACVSDYLTGIIDFNKFQLLRICGSTIESAKESFVQYHKTSFPALT